MPTAEFEFIKGIKLKFPCHISNGIGDDCAVIYRDGIYELFSTDCMVEGVHFLLQDTDPYWIGWKLLAVNVSDIAAMGGVPKGALLSIAIPEGFSAKSLESLTDGIADCAKMYRVSIMGGDTSKSKNSLFLNVAIWGQMTSLPILRSGAKENDLIFVTGALGGSILGRHLRVHPRAEEMFSICKAGINSAIDISDGLLGDLKHIADESSLVYEINASQIPVHQDAKELSKQSKKSSLHHALVDGEDFEIVFTCSEEKREKILQLRSILPELTEIGKMKAGIKNKILNEDGSLYELEGGSFEHYF